MTAMAQDHQHELRREALTMEIYVAICLLGVLTAIGEDAGDSQIEAFLVVWGTTLGLAIAHAVAFRIAAKMLGAGRITRDEAEELLAQFVGASLVAAVLSIPILLFPATSEFDAARLTLAMLLAVSRYIAARLGGVGRWRSILYGTIVLVTSMLVALLKNYLSSH
jgi:FtsH-binding integral membrane protein